MGDQDQRRGVRVGGQVGGARLATSFLAAAEVQAGGRLVEQQQLGVGHQRPGDEDPFAFALGQRPVGAVARCSAPTLSRVSRARTSSTRRRFPSSGPAPRTRPTPPGHAITSPSGIRCPEPNCSARPAGAVRSCRPGPAARPTRWRRRRRVLHRRGDAQQGGLTGAVGPDDHPAFVEFHLPVHRPDEQSAVAAQSDAAKVDQQIGSTSSPHGRPQAPDHRTASRAGRTRPDLDPGANTPSRASAASISARVT